VRGRAVSAARGFTLTEILIAIALILIIGALAVFNFERMASGVGELSPTRALQAQIRQARFLALQRRSPVILTHNSETRSFDLLDQLGNVLETMPDGVDDDQAKTTLTFSPILPLKDLTTDPNITDEESVEYSKKDPVPTLLFDPSGVTAPVKVKLEIEGKDPIEYRLDPFSEGPPPAKPENVPPLTEE
jgi:prepilin-type N-terminal cleavage/methylation domain-containing protein